MSNLIQVKFLSDIAKEVYKSGSDLKYQTSGSSGFDLCAVFCKSEDSKETDLQNDVFLLKSKKRVIVSTGLSFAITYGYEIQIRSRSGLAWKNGVFVLNSPGTVDSDYRGELKVILFNSSDEDFKISLGDRICQAVLMPVILGKFSFVDELNNTNRGSGGFGSTGIK